MFSVVSCGVQAVYGVVEVTRTRQRCRSTLAIKNLNNQNLQVRGLLELQILVIDILYVDSAARAASYAQVQAPYEPSLTRRWRHAVLFTGPLARIFIFSTCKFL